MQVIQTIEDMRKFSQEQHRQNRSLGFVPTMGYLHSGHCSLLDRCVADNDVSVMSLFVNPTQFMSGEDLEQYPQDLEGDLAKAESCGIQAVFAPSSDEMYPEGFSTSVFVSQLSDRLCGLSRGSGHFRGVATIVTKLFNIVQPDRAYFGQKDAQQFIILDRMVRELNIPVDIVPCPIVREEDGLAMSSRNSYLSAEERQKAPVLYQALTTARQMLKKGEIHGMVLLEAMSEIILAEEGVELDYIEIVDPTHLKEVAYIDDTVLIAGAIKVGNTRLIDNLIIHPELGPWDDHFGPLD